MTRASCRSWMPGFSPPRIADVLAPSAARREVDDAVFDALRLTRGERDAVYDGVKELVVNRKQRART